VRNAKGTLELLSYKGPRLFKAKNDTYPFDIFDDIWIVGPKIKVNLAWMHGVDFDEESFIQYRLLVAKFVSLNSAGTVRNVAYALKALGGDLTLNVLQSKWTTLSDSYKDKLTAILRFAILKGFHCYQAGANFAIANEEARVRRGSGSNILDPVKGVYSEFEYQSLQEQIRLDTSEQLKRIGNKHYTQTMLHNLGTTIAIQLMVAIIRRPTQLREIKWCDILPVGFKFSARLGQLGDSIPEQQPSFSDVDVLHIRTFRGKNGKFRKDVERRSHRIDQDLSRLILIYRQKYQALLTNKLLGENINLSLDDINEIMNRLPVFCSQELLSPKTIFNSKTDLFKSTGFHSQSFHKTDGVLTANIVDRMRKLHFKSDRIESDKLSLSDNRLRHTVLSEGARKGESAAVLASITGVTLSAIKPYIELDFDSRLLIDQALASHYVLSKFASQSISELQKNAEFVVKNEFDEEIGIQINIHSCSDCQSKLGAPMGCYGCDNFFPDLHADHKQILDKATLKYNTNLATSNKDMLRKLSKSILYIQATITVCHDTIKAGQGVRDDRN